MTGPGGGAGAGGGAGVRPGDGPRPADRSAGGPGDGESLDPARLAGLAARLAEIRDRIAAAARAAGRDPADLTLIAVSKTRPAADVVMMHTLGVSDFAENREQEAGPKVSLVTRSIGADRAGMVGSAGSAGRAATGPQPAIGGPTWHFIGQLQRNKVRSVLRWADWVQSVDRPGLVPVLSRLAVERDRPLAVCLQVSLDPRPVSAGTRATPAGVGPGSFTGEAIPTMGEASVTGGRGGVAPAELAALADLVAQAPGLELRGVMAVAPRGEPARSAFARLREVAERLRSDHPRATVVSAGMSGDLEAAVAEGATHLRIGTALFGERPGVP